MTRRDLLRIAAGLSAGAVGTGLLGAAACAPQAPATQAPAAPKAPAGQPPVAQPTAAPAAPPKPTAAPAPAATSVSFTYGNDIVTTQPHADTTRQTLTVMRHIYESLVERDDDGNLVPLLAASWKRLDSTTMEFKLREGVKFHNGAPLTANDVKFSFDRMLDKSLNLLATTFVGTLARVDVVDPMTVRITTSKADPILLARLAYMAVVIVPAEAFKSQGAQQFAKAPIGTGPYRFVEWVKDDHLTMQASPDYWGPKPQIGKITYRGILEASTRIAALRTGAVDLAALVEPQQIPEIEADPKLRISEVRSARTIFICMNSFRKPFSDVRVRQAMNYAVDVDAIIKDLLGGHAYRTPAITGPAYFGYDPNQKPYPFDPAKAKALLAEAGYPNGFDITLNSPKGHYLMDLEVAQAISGYLTRVGVKANVEVLEWGNYVAKALDLKNADNRFTFFLMGVGNPIMDLDDTLGSYFDSKRRGLYYNDPKLDELIVTGQTTDDAEARKAVYREALAHIFQQAPWIFLFNPADIYGVNKRLTGWKARADEAVLLSRTPATG